MEQNLVMLIVDDFEINRAVLKNIFREKYEIFEAEDGEKALYWLHTAERVDVILLDIVMPKMDGIQLLKKIKQDPTLARIPVIVNTQMGEKENENKCLELGADDFISKPYHARILKQRVANLVEKYVLERKLLAASESSKEEELFPKMQTKRGVTRGMMVIEATDRLNVVYINDTACSLLGYKKEELQQMQEEGEGIFANYQEEEYLLTKLRMGMQREQNIRTNVSFMCKNKEKLWVNISANLMARRKDKLVFHVMMLNLMDDDTMQNDMIESMEVLRFRAERDALTGIYNRETFYEKLEELVANNPEVDYVLIMCNIDHFKVVNELFGSAMGDQVLIDLAHALEKGLKGAGLYARMEADHFAVCISKEELENNRAQLEKLLREGISVADIDYTLYLRLGIYIIKDRTLSANKMCDRARLAIQVCHGNYMRRWAVYQDALKDSLLNEQALENEMEKALNKGEFFINYQPIFSARTNELVSAEALVRWRHPKKGIISPGNFIPLFEKNGFITKLDNYVWENVCRFLAENERRGIPNVPISVNVSRVNLYKRELSDYLEQMTKHYGIDKKYLKLEITESVYTENPQQLLQSMEALHKKNFKILMDDFGSGYSSLNMLKDVPVDILKIDMEFIDNLDTSERACKILYNIIQMAHGLDMDVVAEGVENENQFELLKHMGCDSIQGYYFSKPLEEQSFIEEILKKNKILHGRLRKKQRRAIMVVSADAAERTKTVTELQEEYDVLQAENGMRAMEILNDELADISLIITDLDLPKLDGFALLSELKKSDFSRNIPVIVLSNVEELNSEIRALKLGAIDVIRRPYQEEILLRRVQNILKVALNEHTEAELHTLRKSKQLWQKISDILKGDLVGIARFVVYRPDNYQTIRIVFANQEYGRIHKLTQTNLTAVNWTKSIFSDFWQAEQERLGTLIRQAIKLQKRQLQVVYRLKDRQGNPDTVLCNLQFEYHEEEVFVDVAEIQAFYNTMFEKPQILEKNLVGLLSNTGINFWKYNMIENRLEIYPHNGDENQEVCIYEDILQAFKERLQVEKFDDKRVMRMHERLRTGEPMVQEIFWCKGNQKSGLLDGEKYWNRVTYYTIYDEYGTPVLAIGISEDVTELIKERAGQAARHREEMNVEAMNELDRTSRLMKMALTRDTLTQVLSRTAFAEQIDEVLRHREAKTVVSAFLVVDIDNFKEINRNFGHDFGNNVLRTIAQQLMKIFRKGDYIGRVGGDKFAIFVPYAASKGIVLKRAEKICSSVSIAFMKNEQVVNTSCSVGIAFCPDDGDTFYSLSAKADSALYIAKQKGKNRYCTANETEEGDQKK